jgi:hypothetical protein
MASMVEALWRMAATPLPKGIVVKQVAGAVQGVLEAIFGPTSGRIWGKGLESKLLTTTCYTFSI